MENPDALILAAWKRLAPVLRDDPGECRRRLARRATPALRCPPRAWCLAIRAADTRLDATPASLLHNSPTHAAPPRDSRHRAHEITLTAPLLRTICAPVVLARPGEPARDVARKLGRAGTTALLFARLRKVFTVHHVRGLGGKRGRPQPLLYTPQPLDPSARLLAAPDPLWSWTYRNLPTRLPDDFAQTLVRVPAYRPTSDLYRRLAATHPEAAEAWAPERSLRLPPPQPDFVWYKWIKDDRFLGDDPRFWRKRPDDPGDADAADLAMRHALRLAEKRRLKRREKPRPRKSTGSEAFIGWRWLCPSCGKSVRNLYLPLPPLDLITPRLGRRLRKLLCSAPRPAAPKLACAQCHRVRRFSRVAPDAWNEVISYLSGGLLYGHEVPRPAWFSKSECQQARKRPYQPRINARPSLRREQVTELLLEGLTYAQIAARIGVKPVTLTSYARRVYIAHGVHGRAALARKLGRADPRPTIRSKVQRLLEEGMTKREIAEMLDLTRKAVNDHVYVIRRSRGKTQAFRREGASARREGASGARSPVGNMTTLAPSRPERV